MGRQTGEGTRRVVVRLTMPFALERRGRSEREAVVGWDGERTAAYLKAMRREIEANADQFADCTVAAVRLGGGVATNAPAAELYETMRCLRRCLRLEDGAPVSARASVNNVSGASMPLLRRAGVTRLDLDLQALDRADFVRLNHADAIQNLPYVVDNFLHAYANKTLGFVLAFGYDARGWEPAETAVVRPGGAGFRRSLVEVTRSPACHLILERWRGAGVPPLPDDPAEAQLAEAREVLGAAGWVEYAPRRFAKPGDEDPVWSLPATGVETLGFGLGAQTRFGSALSTNASDWDTYLRFSDDFTRITAHVERLEA